MQKPGILDIASAPLQLLAHHPEEGNARQRGQRQHSVRFLDFDDAAASMCNGSRPSTVRKTGYSRSVTSTSITALSSTMIERLVRTCGQIGVITNAPESGARIGPAGRKRIGGRSGRRRDDQSIGVEFSQRFAVHARS